MAHKSIGELARPLMESSLELLDKKNQDYGSGNLIITGVRGVAVRLMDKAQRLLTLTEEKRTANFESIEDTFKDAANYGVIGQLLQQGVLTSKAKLVYLAGPIDTAHLSEQWQRDHRYTWREELGNILEEAGHTCYNPSRSFINGQFGVAKSIVNVHNSVIEECDVLIAYLVSGVTLGTAREIEFAKSLGKRVIAMIPENYEPLAIHDLECVYSLEDAAKHV